VTDETVHEGMYTSLLKSSMILMRTSSQIPLVPGKRETRLNWMFDSVNKWPYGPCEATGNQATFLFLLS